MPRFAVLLRGVNVGGANRVPMAAFRSLLESLGYDGVRTLLNSGNAVFGSSGRSASEHAMRIHRELVRQLSVEVPTLVKAARAIALVRSQNPLAALAKDPSRLLVAFTPDAKSLRSLETVGALVRAPERFHLGAQAAYLWCARGILESRAALALLGKSGQAVTTRNWATLLKLDEALREPS